MNKSNAMNFKAIAIIPARGGSKGIPQKNIMDFASKPLIAWTIDQARKSQYISDIYVSTDSNEIAEISSEYGAKIIKRPKNISSDYATSESAIIHVLENIENDINYVVFLQATSPLRKAVDIDNAIGKLITEESDSLLSVVNSHKFIWRDMHSSITSLNYDYKNRLRRQDFGEEYQENGSIYIFKPEVIRMYNNRLGGKIALYVMEQWQQFEIDTRADIDICETMFNKYLKNKYASIPKNIELIVYDFDGIMTDNKAIINQDGKESVSINRSDGLAISKIKDMGISQLILSTEKNNVVQKRADKLNIPVLNGVENKKKILNKYIKERKLEKKNVIYFGNDLNDLEVMNFVGFSVAPQDAYFEILDIASLVTKSSGGAGVIREFYNLLTKMRR
jgi:YrbI family 3-deoxy-D-manno-octulosonate 8-phosphate phosphatase